MSNTAKNIEIVDMTNKFHQSSNELDQLTNAERFDRQNRVYGIDGTKKLQNGIVVIIGPICDLTYEVCKNLALSGIKHIKLCLNNQIESHNFLAAHLHELKKPPRSFPLAGSWTIRGFSPFRPWYLVSRLTLGIGIIQDSINHTLP